MHEEKPELTDMDYILKDGAAWFEYKNIAIRLYATDEGMVCDMYPNHHEMEEPIASAYAFFHDAIHEEATP